MQRNKTFRLLAGFHSRLGVVNPAIILAKKVLLAATLMMLFSVFSYSQAQAANWYVRPSGGSGSGTSWTAAWNGFGSINWGSVSCGDTIWVAGGTYTAEMEPHKACSSGSRLYVRRARSDSPECTGATGWSSSYDSTIKQMGAGISIYGTSNYVTISGRTTATGGSYGWIIDKSSDSHGAGIVFWGSPSNTQYDTFEYMELKGPGYKTYTGDGRGIDATPFSTCIGNTFSHLKIYNWESGAYNVSCNYSTFEYIEMYDIGPANWETYHPNGIFISKSTDGVVRYNKFHKGPNGLGTGEGVFFEQSGGSDRWQIYGNLFYDLDSTGLKAIETYGTTYIKIFNNTFSNVLAVKYGEACGTGSEFRNNLIYNSAGVGSCGSASNNLNINTPNPFVNLVGKDFHIVSTTGGSYPRNAGINLSTQFRTDMNGNIFGSDGTWDIGAYEYNSSSGGSPTPMSPGGLAIK